MYTFISESTNSEFQGKIEFPNLKDLYKESPLHQEIEYFSLSKLYDNLDYDVVVLKPVDDDFLILYANSTLWGIINIDFSEYMKGRYLSELFPKFIELNTLNKFHYSFEHETSNDVVIKFYKDETLLFAGQQFCVKHDDLLYVFAKNETEYYSNQVKEDTIFEESIFPKIQVSRYGEILKINKEFFKVLGYTFEELNQIGLDNIIRNFKASTAPVDNFTKTFTYIFRNNIPVVDAEIEIISKNNISKLFTSHARLFTNDKINVTLSEITDYKKSKRIFFSLMNYFKELEGFKNIAFNLCDGETFQWTPNIFEMLEIPEDDSLLEMSEDIICDYVVPEDKVIIEEKLNKISISNTLNLDYRVKTGKGRIKYFRTVLRGLSEDEGYFSFTTDITEEYNVRKEAIELQRNLNVISSSSNLGMVQFKEGKYYYTPEVYKILDIESEDYVSDFDIIKPLVVDDEDSWLDIINHLTPTNSRARKLTTLLTEKGNVKIIENIVEAEFDENNEIKSYVSFVRDITEEEFAKQNALELQENLRSIEEFSKIVLVSFKDGEFSWTPEIYNILKINPKDYLPNENILKDFIVEEDLLLFNEKVESLTAEDNSFSLVIRVKDSEGELKYLKNQIVFNFNDNNNFLSANALLQDVTEEFLAKESAFELQKSLEIIEKRNNFVLLIIKRVIIILMMSYLIFLRLILMIIL
jgi:PAS domain-containing protein